MIDMDLRADVLDAAFAATPFLGLPDGSAARLAYVATTSFDQHEDAGLYRRDLVYSVEFPTTQTTTQPAMLFGVLGLDASVNTV